MNTGAGHRGLSPKIELSKESGACPPKNAAEGLLAMPCEQNSAGANVPSNCKREVLQIFRTRFWARFGGQSPRWMDMGTGPKVNTIWGQAPIDEGANGDCPQMGGELGSGTKWGM